MTSLPLLPHVPTPFPDEADAGFGCLRCAHGPLPLALFAARLAVDGPCYRWAIVQEFRNVHRTAIEAVYIFPLPPRAAVTRFRLRVGGRTVEGVLQERGQARAAYHDALQAGKRAALLEEDRPNVFTVQVGNLQPGERASVELELSGQVGVEAGHAEIRLPLVVAPRYIPGVGLGDDVGAGTAADTDAVPDASRISPPVLLPGFPNPVRLDIQVDFRPGATLDAALLPSSSLPTLVETVAGDGTLCLRVVPGQRLDRDFILRWPVLGATLAGGALATSGVAGTTVAITLAPPQATVPPRPRDVVVLLDRSGSMDGWKMVAARRAAARMVDALDSCDRFAVLAFDDTVSMPPGHEHGLLPGSDRERFAAVGFLGAIGSAGGTEIDRALAKAFALLDHAPSRPAAERILVLITDGQVGNEDALLRTHASGLAATRVIALGIDQAVNESLLARLATPGGGWWACVESEDWLDAILAEAQRRVQPPLLSGLRVELEGLVADGLLPEPLPDLGGSAPLTLLARCSGRPTSVRVHARHTDGSPWSAELALAYVDAPAIAQAWGRGAVQLLEDRYAATKQAGLPQRIVALSLAEQVLSRFTAFVAVDQEATQRTGPLRTVVQAVERVLGWERPGAPPAAAAPSPATQLFGSNRPSRRAVVKPSFGKLGELMAEEAMPPVTRRMASPGTVSRGQLSAARAGGTDHGGGIDDQIRMLRMHWETAGDDAVRRALVLRAAATRSLLAELRRALAPAQRELAQRIEQLLTASAPPATLAAVQALIPAYEDLLRALASAITHPATQDRTGAPPTSNRASFWS